MSTLALAKTQHETEMEDWAFFLPQDALWGSPVDLRAAISWLPSASSRTLVTTSPQEPWEGESDTSLVKTQEQRIHFLARLFNIKREATVVPFIQSHSVLIAVLEEAFVQIQERFGPGTRVFLELVTDPEIPESKEIFGYISSRLQPEEALRRLGQFDRSWLARQQRVTGRMLNFDIEFE